MHSHRDQNPRSTQTPWSYILVPSTSKSSTLYENLNLDGSEKLIKANNKENGA